MPSGVGLVARRPPCAAKSDFPLEHSVDPLTGNLLRRSLSSKSWGFRNGGVAGRIPGYRGDDFHVQSGLTRSAKGLNEETVSLADTLRVYDPDETWEPAE